MLLEIFLLFLLVFIYLYRFITKDFNFFDGMSIPVMKPSFPFGSKNVKDMFTAKISFLEIAKSAVDTYPGEKVIGYFMFQTPRFLINDEELAKQILIKDFEYFTDRPVTKSSSKIFNNFLTNIEGSEWKRMRVLMSGVFTSGKLKSMYPYLRANGENFGAYIEKTAKEGKEIDMKEAGGLLTLDSIATVGFGIEINSFEDPKNIFRLMALKLINAPGHESTNPLILFLKALLIKGFPKIGNDILKLSVMHKESTDFFADIVRRTYKQRLETGKRRNDLIDLIIDELKKVKKGDTEKEVPQDEFEENASMDTSDVKNASYDDEEIVLIANAILFFFAGFDTSATGFGMVCHKLCLYPDIQEKVYEEIMDVFGTDGKITFEKLGDLKYMDMFISESLRDGNLVPQLERTCTKNYKIPGTNVVIPKGVVIGVYVGDVAYDEKNFVNAKEFDPENFNPDNKPNKFAFQSFGQGPRNCIGMRYALLVIKIGLVNMLRHHKIVRGSTMMDVLRLNKKLNGFEGGLPATFTKREMIEE